MTRKQTLEAHELEPLAYTISEACFRLRIGRTSLYKLANCNKIRLIRIAGRTLVPHSELERLIVGDHDVSDVSPPGTF